MSRDFSQYIENTLRQIKEAEPEYCERCGTPLLGRYYQDLFRFAYCEDCYWNNLHDDS